MRSFFFLLLSCTTFHANPFQIPFEEKKELTEADWIQMQNELKKINIFDLVEAAYPKEISSKTTWFSKPDIKKKSDFIGRIRRGVNQVMIDPAKNKLPQKKLIQINQGGDCCIVSFASYNGTYAEKLETIPKDLEKTGFQGYFLSMTGGFPNPTGKEIQYSGVPYCFKIFALLEAQKLGFDKVLWIDAAIQPLNNPKPLFDQIEKTGCFFNFRKNGKRYLLPQTREILLQETGIDMYTTPSVRAQIVGLDLKAPHVKQFIEEYYALVKLGTPFMSCFPEEHVFGALAAKQPKKFQEHPLKNLVKLEEKLHGKDASWAQNQNYFFLLKKH